MDLRIKYLTTNVEDIMVDMLNYNTNNEKINFLLDTKSYLATIATKLESEIISPLTHYEGLFKMLPEKNEGADLILRALCSSIRTIADDRKKVGFTDSENYADDLLKEQIPMQVRELRAVIKFIDEQVEILEKKIKNSSERVVLEPIKETDNDVFGTITPDKILEELEKLEFEEQNPFIKKVLSDIEMKYGKDSSTAPMQIRILQTSLIGKQMINRGLESIYGFTKTKEDIEPVENEIESKQIRLNSEAKENLPMQNEIVVNVKQRDKIKTYLRENYPKFKSNPTDIISQIAAELVTKLYPSLIGVELKKKIEAIRVELTNIRNGKIPF